MPKRPEVTPENYLAFYDFYEERTANPRLTELMHRAASRFYSPITEDEDGAIGEIGGLVRDGYRIIYTCNHEVIFDQNAVDAELQKHDDLKGTTDNIIVPAKMDYFKGISRWLFDQTPSIPVVRPKDVNNDMLLTADPARRFLRLAVNRLIKGSNMLVFPEGTRSKNRESGEGMGDIMGGTAFIAYIASKKVPIAISSIGIRYSNDKPKFSDYKTPYLYFCSPQKSPLDGPFEDKLRVAEELGLNSARALQKAIEMSQRAALTPSTSRR